MVVTSSKAIRFPPSALDAVCTLCTGRRVPSADTDIRLSLATNKDHETSSIGYLLDLSEKFHMILPKMGGWGVDNLGCSCEHCYKHVHCCHCRLLRMVLDFKVKVPAALEIAEPAVRKGRVIGHGTAGQRRKQLPRSPALCQSRDPG